ncbi:MAG: PDGLE domain-containing protein, partial [Microcystis panniformis]
MNIRRNSHFFLIGLVLSLIIAVFLSPFASPDPDGLDRVAEDLQFSQKKDPNALGN